MPSGLPPDWDSWLASQGNMAGFCQTSAWARIHAAVNGGASYVVSVDRLGARVGGALVSLRPVAMNNMSLMKRLLLHAAGRADATLECLEGPVLSGDDVQEVTADLLSQISTLAKRLRVKRIRFASPPALASWAGSEEVRRAFQKFGYEETNWLTSVVDLKQDEESLRRQLKHAVRKNIRKSRDAGLTTTLCDSHDRFIGVFCKSYYAAANADEARSLASRNEAFWRADSERRYRFFVVEDSGGNVYATLGTYSYQGVATEIMSRRTSLGTLSNLPAQDLLHWDVMLHHKRGGDLYFNLAGYNPDPVDDKETGIRRFKEKWGGRERAVPAFTWSHETGRLRLGRWLQAKAGSA